MAIAYRSGSTAGNASGGNLTVTKPTGVVDGDILIACLYREAGSWTLPAGWTQIVDQAQSTTLWVTLAWKRASSEGADYAFTLSTTAWRTIVIGAFSGCLASGDPVDVSTGTNNASGYPTLASVTTTADNYMEVGGLGNYSGGNLAYRSGTSLTQGPYLGGCEIWYATKATAGATGSTDFTPSTQTYASVTCALKVAATLALDQEGYRWRNDDGSESGATWAANQDAALTAPIGAKRLRVLVNATGDPATAQYQLEWKKSTDSTWRKVQ